MDAYIQTKRGKIEIAFMEQQQLIRYTALETVQPMEKDILLGQIKKKINRLQAFIVSCDSGQEVMLKTHEIPAEMKAKCTEGARVLLQVTKEGYQAKMPQVSMNLEYPGKYMIWKPYEKGVFLSKKIAWEMSDKKRELLYAWQKQNGGCLIVRTAAARANEAELKNECIQLFKKWQKHERYVRDKEKPQNLTGNWTRIQNILSAQKNHLETILVDTAVYKKRLQCIFPRVEVQTYLERMPVFDAYRITEQLKRALCPQVKLSDYGLNLIFHETDAAVLIDINSGASCMEKAVELAAFENNKESIPLIVSQIRARNLSGVIFIDFINMKKQEHREMIVKQMRASFQSEGKDTEVYGFTVLGFLEMRRTRKGKRLSEYFLEKCSNCSGTGYECIGAREK